ncbi:MAG: lytic transglycosylase domain-containing protein, partial [Prolixibacteraceae bacterium]|nr:lytic transglycosylase domain-containing protein [Prolixibacteraceae bacterium]
AVGLWQFMKGTARDYGLEVSKEVDERYHIEKATRAACDYLLDSFKKYETWTLVTASYNAGMAGVDRQMERQKTDNYYDLLLIDETQRYLFRIVALKLILENPAQYNFIISEKEKYPVIQTKKVEITGRVLNFADFAHKQGISYKTLKDFNPWLRENYLTNTAGKKYVIKIPIFK